MYYLKKIRADHYHHRESSGRRRVPPTAIRVLHWSAVLASEKATAEVGSLHI
jgi:hypothetical protein